jgi:LDH2 family malate/lactate/ureidoglycolate dehydrogenase
MAHSEILLPLDKVIATAFKAFKVLNFSDQQAFDVTRQLMYGEIRGGKRNHALDRFLWISKQKDNSFFLDREITIDSYDKISNILILDGNHGMGYSHIYEALICAKELMKYKDSAMIGLKNTYPTNCLGDYSTILANSGYTSYIGSLSPDKVSFPNGGDAVLPTSGQAFGMPGSPHVILDFSIGSVTNGDLNYHKKHQLELPNNACKNKDGEITTNVNEVIDDNGKLIGNILPRGGESASYLMAGFGVMLMMHGIESGIQLNTHGTFLSIRKTGPLLNKNWDDLLSKLTNNDGLSMIPGHRSYRLANKVIEQREIMISREKWDPLFDASSKYNEDLEKEEIDSIVDLIIKQLDSGHYCSLNNTIEAKYRNFFK